MNDESYNLVELLDITSSQMGFDRGPRATGYVHLPWVGELAYLHTIFAPADDRLLLGCSKKLAVPLQWQQFFKMQNGANLFLNSLYIYGFVDGKRSLDRTGMNPVPFNIEEQNRDLDYSLDGEWLLIASYGYSGARVLISRLDARVIVIGESQEEQLASWDNPFSWLGNELKRLSVLFDSNGRLLADERFTEPRLSKGYGNDSVQNGPFGLMRLRRPV